MKSMSKQGARILVVDDEVEIIRVLRRSLTAQGYQVYTTGRGEEVQEMLTHYRPDLLLLDLGLPDLNGLDVCRQIRTVSQVPIIVLSVKDSEYDKVQALEQGADDYIAKPFGIQEVLARVRVALRHLAQMQANRGAQTQLIVSGLEVDLSQRSVKLQGKIIQLTPTEYDLLKVFITHRGKILTRQMLLRLVWGENAQSRLHSLHVYIAQLRRKIEPDINRPRFILTVPSIGYRFCEEEESAQQASDGAFLDLAGH
jgi:two-component system KDP operon response regulator KdpE